MDKSTSVEEGTADTKAIQKGSPANTSHRTKAAEPQL